MTDVVSVSVRLAAERDREFLLKMHPYAKSRPDRLSCDEDVLVAESNGAVVGAVSVSHKDISCVFGEWRADFEQRLDELKSKVSGGWISRLYVFPGYRYQGVGTELVAKAVERLRKKGFVEAYCGIYVRNKSRRVSASVFERNGFKAVGSCLCALPEGHCRGMLLRRTTRSDT